MSKKETTLQDVLMTLEGISQSLGKPVQALTLKDCSNNGLSERQLGKFGNLNKIKKAYYPVTEKSLGDIQELGHQAKYINKLEKAVGSRELFEREMKSVLAKLKPVEITPFKSEPKKKISRAISLVLSDLHFGSDIKKEETGKLDYGRIEESRRLARVIQETLEYKPQYRAETELNLLILGDVIQHQLHDPRDGAPLAEQAARAIHLLSQAIGQCVARFPKVKVIFATGNHGRNTARHHGRATNQKWDSIETIIYFALKNAFRTSPNITFDLPLTPFAEYKVFGKKVFVTHGDGVLNVGYPGSNINTKSIETQINKINAALPDSEEYVVFVLGHVHTGAVIHLGNGSVVITNGPLVPSDQYAVSIGLMEAACGQQLFESVPGFPVGDIRYIKVSIDDDKNAELDKLIQPWESL